MKTEIIKSGTFKERVEPLSDLGRLTLDFARVNPQATKQETTRAVNYMMMAYCLGRDSMMEVKPRPESSRVRGINSVGDNFDFKNAKEAIDKLDLNNAGLARALNEGLKYRGYLWKRI